MNNESVDMPEAGMLVDVESDVAAAGEASVTQAIREPNWWHRDHPVFTSLVGFFTGLLFFILVPGLYGAVLNWIFDYDTAEELFPYVLVALAIPIGLLIAPATRRFGRYMALGIVSTALVVLGVAALTFWVLLKTQG